MDTNLVACVSLVLLSLSQTSFQSTNSNEPAICNMCKKYDTNEGIITSFCHSMHKVTTTSRCCWNSTGVIGLDLSNCSLTTLEHLLSNYTSLVALDLRENDALSNFSAEHFTGLSSLSELYLPENTTCPGGQAAWNYTDESTFCEYQNNPCEYFNISCLNHGMCHHLSPGLAQCQCKEGFSGYKCLIKGKFPTVIYSVVLTVSTLVLSAGLWWTQRRKVVAVM